MKTQQALKEMVALAAVDELRSLSAEAVVGVGTGSTVDCFIDALAAAWSDDLRLKAFVSSSERSEKRLRDHGLPVCPLADLQAPMAVYVDGADEIAPDLSMIKGGGAALTREKIVASAAQGFICIVDESKCVAQLGAFPLPIEVIEMAIRPVCWALEALGGRPVRREGVITDNGHPILDVHGLRIDDALAWEDRLNALPGVVANGVFAHQRASLALVSSQAGIRRLSSD